MKNLTVFPSLRPASRFEEHRVMVIVVVIMLEGQAGMALSVERSHLERPWHQEKTFGEPDLRPAVPKHVGVYDGGAFPLVTTVPLASSSACTDSSTCEVFAASFSSFPYLSKHHSLY